VPKVGKAHWRKQDEEAGVTSTKRNAVTPTSRDHVGVVWGGCGGVNPKPRTASFHGPCWGGSARYYLLRGKELKKEQSVNIRVVYKGENHYFLIDRYELTNKRDIGTLMEEV